MATVRLADVYNPLTFARREQEAQLELNAFAASGVMATDAALAAQISTGGNIGEIANYNPLATDEPNYSNDNPADTSTPKKVDSTKQKFRLTSQNQSWSVMDLSRELALEDPVGAITNRIGAYWATNNQRRLISCALGILADNIANDSGDMLVNRALDTAAPVTDAERINATTVLDAKQTMGDHASKLTAIAMHSVLFTRLQKQNLIEFIVDSESKIRIPTYLGYRVIQDDNMPAVAGAERITYTVAMFGMGAFGWAPGKVMVPSELDRKPDSGNGGGEDVLYSRRNELIHPLGFSFTDTTVTGQSATRAELELAANWDRVHDRKHIPLAFLRVND